MTVPPINVDDLVAIDVHTHAEVSSRGQGSLSAELTAASSTYFKVDGARRRPTLTDIAAYYRERRMSGAVFTVDAESATGELGVPAVFHTGQTGIGRGLSGWSPKYFPASLVQYANTLLKDKVLFGSDYPLLGLARD